jgi:5-dehydro-2-deoxygluconokinase
MLEVLPVDGKSNEDRDLAEIMVALYRQGIAPTWWKIEAPASADAFTRVTQVIDEFDKSAGVIILGKNKALSDLNDDFRRVASSRHAIGFAVGRTLFAEPWYRFVNGELSADEAGKEVARNFEECVQLWNTARLGACEKKV